jgi:TonB family protein
VQQQPSESSAQLPRLELTRTGRAAQLASSVSVLLKGPIFPEKFSDAPFFRDCWIEPRFPKWGFAAAILIQILLVKFPPPIWKLQPPRNSQAVSRTQLTWYGPIQDFPVILPSAPKRSAPLRNPALPDASRGADAFHPRQTILSSPLHPNHPRQLLVQSSSAPEPPKILPALPNIVELASSRPEKPKLQLTPEQLLALRPKQLPQARVKDAAAPEIAATDRALGAINLSDSSVQPAKPTLRVAPMAAPRASATDSSASVAAPEIAQGNDQRTLIALSANPGPAAPAVVVPPGNLSARLAISPEGLQPGAGGNSSGSGASGNVANGAGGGHGPEGLFISPPAPGGASGAGPRMNAKGVALPPRLTMRDYAPSKSAPRSESGANTAPKLGLAPEQVLRDKHVYTLHVNMPNMTSASGSWVLNFAELNEMQGEIRIPSATAELAAPVPVRKVDPKYPPELRAGHVEGEVILYAVIRKDGTVDSIQLVHSVDPNLDANAMEALALWKFRPAERHGEPVDLEAVVHIPFRSRVPQL